MVSDTEVVPEPVCGRLHYGERVHIGLFLRSVRATRREGNLHVMPGLFRSFLNGRAAAQNNQVRKRNFLTLVAVGLRTVELLLNPLQLAEDLGQLCRLVHRPTLLRSKANACPICPTTLAGAAEGRRRG